MDSSDFKGTAAALSAAMDTQSLTDREKHLVGLAVTVTRGCTYCTGGRIKRAIEEQVKVTGTFIWTLRHRQWRPDKP